jgi:hypothetical protein
MQSSEPGCDQPSLKKSPLRAARNQLQRENIAFHVK